MVKKLNEKALEKHLKKVESILKKFEKGERKKKKANLIKKIFKKPKVIKKKEAKKEIILKEIKKRAKKIPTILVKDIMIKPVVIDANASIEKAIEILSPKGITSAPVVSGNKVIGVVSESDIINFITDFVAMKEGELTKKKDLIKKLSRESVKTIMKKNPKLISPRDSIEKAIRMMNTTKLNEVCVAEGKKLVGFVTKEEIIAALKKSEEGKKLIQSEIVVTDVDKLLSIIKSHGEISSEETARMLNLKKETIEDWAKILAEKGLIEVEYPVVGSMILKIKK